MIGPLIVSGLINESTIFPMGLFLGMAVGFTFERSGFGNSKKVIAQFLLKDLSLFKMLGTALVTSILGLSLLNSVGLLDVQLLGVGETYVLPQALGGTLLGMSIMVSGYCPSTSFVAIGTGKIDAIAVVLGMLAGTFLYAEFSSVLEEFSNSSNIGRNTLNLLFKMPYGQTVMIVVLILAIGLFLNHRFERRIHKSR